VEQYICNLLMYIISNPCEVREKIVLSCDYLQNVVTLSLSFSLVRACVRARVYKFMLWAIVLVSEE